MSKTALKPIDSFTSWQVVQRQIDAAVKCGSLTREKAAQVLKDARAAYSKQDYNRTIERMK